MKKYIFIVILLLCASSVATVSAQNIHLPHAMTPAEQKIMADYLKEKHSNAIRSIPTPPPGQVRTMAEWEEIQALIITWSGQTTILKEIVRNAVKECKVLIITTNPDNVASQLTNSDISLDSVEFVNTPFNSIWVRDYGPWSVYKNDVDSLWIVDWIYNRPRQNDDASPRGVATHLNLPIYEATSAPFDWVHTGGNHLPDGMGNAFSSILVLEENPDKTEAQIDSLAKIFLGVNEYIKLPTLPYDGIHHLDMHMRIIDEETIFFGEYPEGVSDGPQIESNINYITEEHNTAFGNKYNILRLPMPPDANNRYPSQGGHYRTYTNSVFVNKTVLVPTYEERYDTTALRIYRENLPGYNIVGINCNSIIPSLGAIHCITKLVGTENPLLIAHPRLRDSDDANLDYPVVACIKHRHGIASAEMYYRVAPDSTYSMVPMVLVDTAANSWAALIPPQLAGSEIQYYIHAVANDGKEQVRPLVAPDGYFKFRIHGELPNQPPVVQILQPLDESIFNVDEGLAQLVVEASDPDGHITNVKVIINFEEVASFDTLPYTFDWTFPGVGSYYAQAQATDDDGAIVFSTLTKITIEESTAIQMLSIEDVITIFPNPVTDMLYLEWHETPGEKVSVGVYNTMGQFLPLNQSLDAGKYAIDFSKAPSGIYFLKVRSGTQVFGGRVVKK